MFSCSFWYKTLADPAIFWPMATTIVTVVLAFVAWIQLRDLAQTSRADFIFRMKSDFFTEETRRLLFLVEEDFIEFEDDHIPYFSIRTPGGSNHQRFSELGIAGSTVSTYVVDDCLLGPFEDIDLFLMQGLINPTHAREMFQTYIAICWKNAEIQKYIEVSRQKHGNANIYSGFDDLYRRLCLADH